MGAAKWPSAESARWPFGRPVGDVRWYAVSLCFPRNQGQICEAGRGQVLRRAAELSLNGQVRRHRVRSLVPAKHAPSPTDWGVARPIYAGVGIRRRHAVGRNIYGKLLNKVRTRRRANKRRSCHRGFRAGIGQCADVLQQLAAARGAINSLMAELMEDHIHNHMPRNSKSSEEAAKDLVEIVRTYLK